MMTDVGKMMKTRNTVMLTVAVTPALQVMLLRWCLTRDIILDLIDPGPSLDGLVVVTNDVVLVSEYDGSQMGKLSVGQYIVPPCRHDRWCTEPCDPQYDKVYVHVSSEAWRSCTALSRHVTNNLRFASIGTIEPASGTNRIASQVPHDTAHNLADPEH